MLCYRCLKAARIVFMTVALFAVDNGAVSLDRDRAFCVSNLDWLGAHWSVPYLREVRDDCYRPAELMMNTDMTEHGKNWFEFAKGNRGSTYGHYPLLSTPRKYTSGRCVVALVTVDYFNPQSILPGATRRRRFPEDEARYSDILRKSLGIRNRCLGTGRLLAGWSQFGYNSNSLGVLVLGKDSHLDRLIVDASAHAPRGRVDPGHTLSGPNNRTSNGTVAATA